MSIKLEVGDVYRCIHSESKYFMVGEEYTATKCAHSGCAILIGADGAEFESRQLKSKFEVVRKASPVAEEWKPQVGDEVEAHPEGHPCWVGKSYAEHWAGKTGVLKIQCILNHGANTRLIFKTERFGEGPIENFKLIRRAGEQKGAGGTIEASMVAGGACKDGSTPSAATSTPAPLNPGVVNGLHWPDLKPESKLDGLPEDSETAGDSRADLASASIHAMFLTMRDNLCGYAPDYGVLNNADRAKIAALVPQIRRELDKVERKVRG